MLLQRNRWMIQVILFFCIMPAFIDASSGRSDEDIRHNVEMRCRQQNLPSYKVAHKHYCCGCSAGQHVQGDCKINHQSTTICADCPYDSTIQTYTSVANTQRQCNITKPPDYCVQFMYTHYVSGSSKESARCECDLGTYALNPEKHGCLKFTPCKPMYYVRKVGNSSHPYECGRCPVGKCTYEYSFAKECLPCNTSNSSIPTAKEDVTPTTIPVTLPSNTMATESSPSLPTWVIPAIACLVIIIFVIVLGILLRKLYCRGSRKESDKNVSQNSGETDQLLEVVSTPAGNQDDEEDGRGNGGNSICSDLGRSISDSDSAEIRAANSARVPQGQSITDSEAPVASDSAEIRAANPARPQPISRCHIEQENHQQNSNENNRSECINQTQPGIKRAQDEVMETAGQVVGLKSVPLEADPHNTDDEPLKGCIRSLSRDEYEPKFQVLGFRIKHEPNMEPNCLFESVAKAQNPDLNQDYLVEYAKAMRQHAVQYIERNREQFHSSITNTSSTMEDYMGRLKNHSQPCDEIVARAISLSEKVNLQLVHVDKIGNKFCCSSEQDTGVLIHIGHVEKNYFLLLENTWERKDGDINASSNSQPVSDSRSETHLQSVLYRPNPDGHRPSSTSSGVSRVPPAVENKSRQHEGSVPNYTKPPKQLRVKNDWNLFDDPDKDFIMKHASKYPELLLELSDHLEDSDIAEAMLLHRPKLIPRVKPMVKKINAMVNDFVRLPDLIDDSTLLLSDADAGKWSGQSDKRHFLVHSVINERGRNLSTRLLLEKSRDSEEKTLHRHFSDCFIKFLQVKYSRPTQNSLPGTSNVSEI